MPILWRIYKRSNYLAMAPYELLKALSRHVRLILDSRDSDKINQIDYREVIVY
jgi:hypothetical protein